MKNIDKKIRGRFYTPIPYAKLAKKYIDDAFGKNCEDNFFFWDMCAGTGNLFYNFKSLKNCFLSTIDDDEVEYLKNNFSEACIWKYDYLNNDIISQDIVYDILSKKLINIINSQSSFEDFIIFINPPYSSYGAGINSGVNKSKVEETKIKNMMDSFGRSKLDLCNQFLYRIFKELPGCKLCVFAPTRYINASVDEKFRSEIFKAKFINGFIFPMSEFDEVKSQAPVSFAIYDTSIPESLENQKLIFDVYSSPENLIGKKRIRSLRKDQLLSYKKRNCKNKKISPPLKNAITLGDNVYMDKIDEDAIGFFHCKSNNVQSAAQKTAFFSSAFSQGGGISITSENIMEIMMIHAIRKIPSHTWINAQDQYMKANFNEEFLNDCFIWSIFSYKNLTSSFSVEYKNKKYFIENDFYPFDIDNQPTTVSKIIKKTSFSNEAQAVLNCSKKIYFCFDERYDTLDKKIWKIENKKAGWYQIRKSLQYDTEIFDVFNKKYKILSNKIKESIYNYGFLDKII